MVSTEQIPATDRWISIADAARHLDVPVTTMRRIIENAALTVERMPGMRPRVNLGEVIEMAERSRSKPAVK